MAYTSNKDKKNEKEPVKTFNPAKSTWGRIVIVVMCIAMGLSGLLGVILLLIEKMN